MYILCVKCARVRIINVKAISAYRQIQFSLRVGNADGASRRHKYDCRPLERRAHSYELRANRSSHVFIRVLRDRKFAAGGKGTTGERVETDAHRVLYVSPPQVLVNKCRDGVSKIQAHRSI